MALPTNKFDKIKIFHWDLLKKIAEEVFWGILPKISMGDKVSPGLSAMLTQTGLMMMMRMMTIIMMMMVIMMMA